MGGIGSGRGYQGGKDTTREYHSLDVRKLQRGGLLASDRSFGWNWYSNGEKVASIQIHTQPDSVILDYRHRKGNEELKVQYYPVMLDWAECNYGGKRAWFLCPVIGCGRRVAMLYLGRSGVFACRHCYKLVYECQRETAADRYVRKADRVRDKLWQKHGTLNPIGVKPKGMHWKTYQRLTTQHNNYINASLRAIAKRIGFLDKILGE